MRLLAHPLENATKKKKALSNLSPIIRVGLVTTSFPLTENSASGIFVKRLVESLPNTVDVTVLTPAASRKSVEKSKSNFTLMLFPYGPSSLQRLAHMPGGIPDAIRRRDPALLLLPLLILAMLISSIKLARHVDIMHGNWSAPGLIASLAAKLNRKPSIVTLRGQDVNRASTSSLFRLVLKACIQLNTKCVVVSQSMQQLVETLFPQLAHKVVFIPNGVRVSASNVDKKFKNPLRLLTISNLATSKRVDTLIDAVSQISPHISISARIIGDGKSRSQINSLIEKLELDGQVKLLGEIAPDNISEHLAWADIFVFTSEAEGRPNAILEAMAAGLPIIATDIPGIRELLKENAGVLFPVGDATRLSEEISRLATSPEHAAQLGRNAQTLIKENNLTWESAAQSYTALYKSAIDTRKEPPCVD